MKKKYLAPGFFLLSFMLCSYLSVFAQEQADAQKTMDSLKTAIEKDPGNLDLHDAYLKVSGFTKWGAKEDPAFLEQYTKWMVMFPKIAAVPYALGHAYAGKESPKAKPYLLKALEIDPKFDKAYFDLWIDAERWGEFDKGSEYIRKASELKPDNPDYAFYYASTWDDKDFQKYKELSIGVANRFPESERGAQALYWLAVKSKSNVDKIKYYEMLKEKFSPSKFNWSSSGMSGYYNLLLEDAPDKAQQLSEFMLNITTEAREKKSWEQNLATAKSFNNVKELMSQQKFQEAINVLDAMKVNPRSPVYDMVLIQKAKALNATGNTDKAYNDLKVSYAILPEPEIGKIFMQYGAQLGKNESDITKDLWYIRDTMARVATPFTLKKYLTPGEASLSDFKGKVVLLTYWFPGCGPCRGEFPHFQNVVDKFKGKDFAYVGINIVPEQNEYVIPFMKSSGYTFIPLEDYEGRNKGNLDNRNAAPVNFLIDKEGRIVFRNIRTDGSNEDVLEAMITSLLDRK
jgi:thiol-disulfide isomerase/thioredoxin